LPKLKKEMLEYHLYCNCEIPETAKTNLSELVNNNNNNKREREEQKDGDDGKRTVQNGKANEEKDGKREEKESEEGERVKEEGDWCCYFHLCFLSSFCFIILVIVVLFLSFL